MNGTLPKIEWNDEVLIPSHVNIETLFGCNAHCTMCIIDQPSKRRKGVMKEPLFRHIIDSLKPHRTQIQKLDLFALGEPLLDPDIMARIRYAKQQGFTGMAISTNADLLTEHMAKELLDTGIETVIFSIDGIDAPTHEGIRRGVCFERVVANAERIIAMRDQGNFPTRFVVRFIRQECNRDQWQPFEQYWNARLSADRNDLLLSYNIHTWGGAVDSKENVLGVSQRDETIEKSPCHHIFNQMIILADGTVPLCCEDFLNADIAVGNVSETDPIAVFNSPRMQHLRKMHVNGVKSTIPMCGQCTVLYSEAERQG
ncbi:radical SAM protein [Pseudodesulfovibrio piezophilus]|uniref:Putative Predicted Fe-S oxidoreductase n=1 Tax=Pseudodesulfovibrio piezophilus (strain DSM 21447 / JCM 15486 / C1TLV30) TaxID=1322246 RepID=M1WWT8_PSEP2|nr:radical SAM protein [Pseudodesulfovibrio piezophilus]CCH49318.1 putative Predicted Fe-S oxidoreductase [Pseudodesulfovibrio piezophilus C1TLV30]